MAMGARNANCSVTRRERTEVEVGLGIASLDGRRNEVKETGLWQYANLGFEGRQLAESADLRQSTSG